MNNTRGYEKISTAFKGALTTGLSLLSVWMDYRDDPDGDIHIHHDPWNSVILDPFFSRRDLQDCDFVSRRKYLPKDQVISLLPWKQDIIEQLPTGERDDKFSWLPYARQWGSQKLMSYTEYWRSIYVKKDMLVDMSTGKEVEWKGDKKRLNLFLRENKSIELVNKHVKTVELGAIVEGELLYYGTDPWGLGDYPFVPFLCIFESSYDLFDWKLQSLVRISRDAQNELNKRRSKTVDMIDSQFNSGWKAKKDAVTNPRSLFQSGQGNVVWVNKNSQMQDVERIQPPDIPVGWFQLEAQYSKDIMEDAGINSEMFGQSDSGDIQTAGVLAKMRQLAGLVNLNGIFDGLNESQQILSRKILILIQKNFSPEKVQRILNEVPSQDFYNNSFSKYDCVVSEGVLTDSQKEDNFIKYLALKEIGVPIPDELIIRASNLEDNEDLAKSLAQQAEQQAQVAQTQQQLAMQELQARANLANSRAAADRGLEIERKTRSISNLSLATERRLEGQKDLEQATLDKIKSMKELQGMDLNQIQQALAIIESLKADESEQVTPELAGISNDQEAPQENIMP